MFNISNYNEIYGAGFVFQTETTGGSLLIIYDDRKRASGTLSFLEKNKEYSLSFNAEVFSPEHSVFLEIKGTARGLVTIDDVDNERLEQEQVRTAINLVITPGEYSATLSLDGYFEDVPCRAYQQLSGPGVKDEEEEEA